MEALTALFVWVLFGLVVGAIARALYPGRQSMGLGTTIMLGIAGSLLGGVISWMISSTPNHPLSEGSGWIMSIVGALIVVWGATALHKQDRTRSM